MASRLPASATSGDRMHDEEPPRRERGHQLWRAGGTQWGVLDVWAWRGPSVCRQQWRRRSKASRQRSRGGGEGPRKQMRVAWEEPQTRKRRWRGK